VLVFHDIVGLSAGRRPRFARQYADLATAARDAVSRFAADVHAGRFPAPEETYRS
jgi:3-methyl-2-oxobutanoate hydroxymethyltransferase